MENDTIKGFKVNSAGYGSIPKMAMQDRRLTISAKATYAYFCSFTGAGDTCFPTRKKICYDLNISNDTLSKQLRLLVDCGYITIEQIKENGRFSHNVYTLTDTILPCPKISDTENSEYGELDTKNNNSKNNNLLKNNRTKERDESPKRTRFVPPTLDEVKAKLLTLDYIKDELAKMGK